MATVGEISSAVRVKRKSFQSPIDALWLDINERPLKRPQVDFANLAFSNNATQKEELITKKVFVQHLETISIPEVTFDVVQFFVKQNQLLLKAKEDQEKMTPEGRSQSNNIEKRPSQALSTAKNARFEQIWKSRRENKESVHAQALQGISHFYDIVRVDEEKNNKAQQEHMSLEDQRLLCSYLPLLEEFIPSAAIEIESDMRAHCKRGENNPLNDYTDEISERESESAKDEDFDEDDFRHFFSKDGDTDPLNDEDFDEDYDVGNLDFDGVDGDDVILLTS